MSAKQLLKELSFQKNWPITRPADSEDNIAEYNNECGFPDISYNCGNRNFAWTDLCQLIYVLIGNTMESYLNYLFGALLIIFTC